MDVFLLAASVVALAEIGDKTQLLALLLAAKFRKPWPIGWGILVATVVNHGCAGALGAWLVEFFGAEILRWVLGVSFIAMAAWILVPDRIGEDKANLGHFGIFGTTLVAFFFAEMGDKTQIATAILAAQYQSVVLVVSGTVVGMMAVNLPAVLFGDRVSRRIPVRVVHYVAAVIFVLLGMGVLLHPVLQGI